MAEAWASIARKDVAPATVRSPAAPATYVPRSEGKSAQGLQTLVVDANALIQGINIPGLPSYDLCTVQEVISEVRDPRARQQLEALAVPLTLLEPSPESLSKVLEFARATGDLHSLSEIDLKVLALAHTLEVKVHGESHLRRQPPPLVRSTVRKNQGDPPGWGSNVPNPEEWDEIAGDDGQAGGEESHVLGLKDLHLALSEAAEDKQASEEKSSGHRKQGNANPRKKPHERLKGKVNVYQGMDASKGEHDECEGEWERGGSRSTRRKHKLRAVRDAAFNGVNNIGPSVTDTTTQNGSTVEVDRTQNGCAEEVATAEDAVEHAASTGANPGLGVEEIEECGNNSEPEIWEEALASQEETRLWSMQHEQQHEDDAVRSVTTTDGTESEQSWTIRPMWLSTVACMTNDFAMQNVILQMGLRLFTPNGVQVRELQRLCVCVCREREREVAFVMYSRWVLKCHACGNVTRDVGRLFCPKCGNGGTLCRVSVSVGANGIVEWGSPRRISIRGTRYSLPLPKGGREGAASNPILREDQLPHRLLFSKTKKKAGPGLDTAITSFDDIVRLKDKKKQGMSKEAISLMLSGRRNPNDLHFGKR